MSEAYDAEATELEIRESAQPAGADTEYLLDRLKHASEMSRDWKAYYEKCRDDVVDLIDNMPRYFIASDDGAKWYAVRQQSEPIEADPEVIEAMHDAGEISDEVYDEVMPRKVDKKAFTRACSTGRITQAQLARIGYVKPSAPYVRFYCYDAE